MTDSWAGHLGERWGADDFSRRPKPSKCGRGLVAPMRQRTLVIQDVAQIAVIDPAATGRAPDKMLYKGLGLITHSSPEDGATGHV
jgi:hypothetical protein